MKLRQAVGLDSHDVFLGVGRRVAVDRHARKNEEFFDEVETGRRIPEYGASALKLDR